MLNKFPMHLIPGLLLLIQNVISELKTDVMCANEYYTLLIDEVFNKHLETFYKNDLDTKCKYKYKNVTAFENKISKFK